MRTFSLAVLDERSVREPKLREVAVGLADVGLICAAEYGPAVERTLLEWPVAGMVVVWL